MGNLKVGVFPAAGGIGGSTVKNLLRRRVQAQDLVFIARYPEKLKFASDAGATVRRADYDDTKTLEHAFDDLDVLFLISYASVEHEHRSDRHRAAIDQALSSGVKYIFYGSLGFAHDEHSQDTVAHVMRPHIDTEKYLEQCARQHPGFAYTIVREGLYCESYPVYTSFFDLNNPVDEIKIPHDGSGPGVAWVKREELGEGTAELLLRFAHDPSGFEYRNKTVRLTGTKVLTLGETVGILGKIAGKPGVRIHQVSNEGFAVQPHVPPMFTHRGVDYSMPWTTAFEGIRRGEAAVVSPLLRELLGREPAGFEATIREQQQKS